MPPTPSGFFREQGVAVKVISGDNLTVAAIAAEVGIPGAEHPIDARQLPEDPDALAAVLERASVFGRGAALPGGHGPRLSRPTATRWR